jgi:hypothetical protein
MSCSIEFFCKNNLPYLGKCNFRASSPYLSICSVIDVLRRGSIYSLGTINNGAILQKWWVILHYVFNQCLVYLSGKNIFILNFIVIMCDNYSYIEYSTNIGHLLLFHYEFGSLVFNGTLRIIHYRTWKSKWRPKWRTNPMLGGYQKYS